ncbi:hypothetical protein COU14_00725 [Candidatus Kaiserbacteria bacterium CG10_big_fil_rev_8_21_14_0_10_44_10]|uniref:Uncharacterized protein n=1 Tax=Candidatus Kaiserbacteria bacterium CG10_big_fil_rev_8_21_14_0_10_44_10 TaxID=1974606 RepID=A0A2H0UI72_9BACT|nr:MAG: hypothetical protein COU14_00725 [Candidatus Kaiserbacteria bacterium CG10_big_fil_rev_8_21_14_0_10_44_10]
MGDNNTQHDDAQSGGTIEDQIRHQGVISEDIQHHIQRLAEAMADVPAKVTSIDERLANMESDMKVVKAAVTDQSGVLHDHETRITQLESAA